VLLSAHQVGCHDIHKTCSAATQKALETARRASDLVTRAGAAAVQAIHPPAAVISIVLSDPKMPPSPEKPAAMQHYITCKPTQSFGKANATEKWCSDLERGGAISGDGTLNSFMMELSGPGWEKSIQVRLFTVHWSSLSRDASQSLLDSSYRRGGAQPFAQAHALAAGL
jgi:hypothetical protein